MPRFQPTLFDNDSQPWDEDDRSEQLTAAVVFPVGPEGEFDYKVPERLAAEVEPGRRVRVPFGRGDRVVTGYCVRVESKPPGRRVLKSIQAVVDCRRLLSPAMLRLTGWIADHYLCPWGQVIQAVVPTGVRIRAGVRTVKLYACLLYTSPSPRDS